jgi:hypothetical protein
MRGFGGGLISSSHCRAPQKSKLSSQLLSLRKDLDADEFRLRRDASHQFHAEILDGKALVGSYLAGENTSHVRSMPVNIYKCILFTLIFVNLENFTFIDIDLGK